VETVPGVRAGWDIARGRRGVLRLFRNSVETASYTRAKIDASPSHPARECLLARGE
jgi:hypothetical protein